MRDATDLLHHSQGAGPEADTGFFAATLFCIACFVVEIGAPAPPLCDCSRRRCLLRKVGWADRPHFRLKLLAHVLLLPLSAVLHSYVLGRKYIGGFYFWLDVIATFTLLLDIKEARLRVRPCSLAVSLCPYQPVRHPALIAADVTAFARSRRARRSCQLSWARKMCVEVPPSRDSHRACRAETREA